MFSVLFHAPKTSDWLELESEMEQISLGGISELILTQFNPYGHFSLKVHNIEFFLHQVFNITAPITVLMSKPNVKYSLPPYDTSLTLGYDISFHLGIL